jgi:hypothetical protein
LRRSRSTFTPGGGHLFSSFDKRVSPGLLETVKKGTVKVEDSEYGWSIYRQPRWEFTTSSLLGLAILVESPERSRRKLILEFSIDRHRHGDMPQHQRFRLRDGRLAAAIKSALEAGWDPESRGKPFVYEAGALQPR